MDAVFGSTGQAVHVAFLVMSQEATQDAPLRKALIRVLESIRLEGKQRTWLDQLRGAPSESINFGGLTSTEVRAQCAMITQAVKQLPPPEMWVLQAKFGQTDFEDVGNDDVSRQQLMAALERERKKVSSARTRMQQARAELEAAREFHLTCEKNITRAATQETARAQYHAARDSVRDIGAELMTAESHERAAQIALDRLSGCSLTDSGKPTDGASQPRRRFAFSAERIDAIKGLSDWLQPLFPRIKPLALDCMLGRVFANHKKMDISFRDLAESFGGNPMVYQRASFKLKNKLRELEEMAIARLDGRLVADGVAEPTEIS
jgi:hypothetical protein